MITIRPRKSDHLTMAPVCNGVSYCVFDKQRGTALTLELQNGISQLLSSM